MSEHAPSGADPEDQLAALAALVGVLEAHGLDYWLFGGWAVDFWVGRVTRAHGDVDVVVRQADAAQIRGLLEQDGWRYAPADDVAIGACFHRGGVLVELTMVTTDERGQVFLPFAEGPGLWSTTPFGSDRRELQGVSCRTIPLEVLVAGKAEPRDDAPDAAKDRADFAELTRSRRDGR